MLLSVNDALAFGLEYGKIDVKDDWSREVKEKEFHAHYGSSPLVLATQWYDLITFGMPEALKLNKQDKERGFRMFLTAHHFLWAYPRNANILASRMGISNWMVRGSRLWVWIQRVAALKEKMIKWPSVLDDPNSEIEICTIDGTDYRGWEKKHPTLPIDKAQCSKKIAHGAMKYQMVVAVQHQKCIHIHGSCRGGLNDKTMLEESGVLDLIKVGKFAIVDRGYINHANKDKLAWPNAHHVPATNNFQSRARLRHETFNGRLKFFPCLNQTFRHGQGKLFEKHKTVVEAVAVTVQYQMDNGSPLFEV